MIFWTRRGQDLLTYAIAPGSMGEVSVDMRVGDGVAGRVAEAGRRAIVRDMLDGVEMRAKGFDLRHTDVVRTYGWRSGMFVPVHAGRRMVGVFGAYSKTPGALRPGLQENVFGAFANRVASELHRDAISEEFNRVTALGFAALDRAHTIDNLIFAMDGSVDRFESLCRRRMETTPDFATPEIRREVTSIRELCSQVGSNFEALIHQDRLRRSTKVRMQPIEPILRAAVSRHAATATSRAIELTLECGPNVVAFVRKYDLDRVIENLIVNALHFHRFRVSVPKRYVRVIAEPRGSRQTSRGTLIMVEDNGPGIPEHERPYVFDLMWSSRLGGSGFGLFFARRIIEAFGGTIDVESVPLDRTCFTIELNR